MKNTRKKMLLSSVAMLLVALVALGSATYAWFTINRVVEANTMKVKAITTAGLVINNKKTADWKRTVSYADTATELKPVSYDFTVGSAMPSGYVANDVSRSGGGAWASGNSDISNFTEVTAIPAIDSFAAGDYQYNKTDYVASYVMDVASSGAAINKAVNATITASTVSGETSGLAYAKAVLLDSDGKVQAWWSDGTSYSAIKTDAPTVGTAKSEAASTKNGIIASPVPTKEHKKTFQLIAWYEGNDPQCLDSAQDAQVNFTVKFTLAS